MSLKIDLMNRDQICLHFPAQKEKKKSLSNEEGKAFSPFTSKGQWKDTMPIGRMMCDSGVTLPR